MGNVRMRAEMIDYGATNVKKALDDLDVSDLLQLNARMDKIDAWKDTVEETTLTGNPVEYQNALALPAKSLTVNLEPDQDLHGYDHPWVGGAGKNKLPMTVESIKAANTIGTWSGNTYTRDNGSFKINTDNDGNVTDIVLTSTNSSDNSIMYIPFTLKSGSYILSNTYSETFGNLDTYLVNSQNTVIARGNSQTPGNSFTLSADENVTLNIRNNINSSTNKVFKPMIRIATESDATFAPYSNICPISGRTESTVNVQGKNLFNEDYTDYTGALGSNPTVYYRYMKLKANTNYTLSSPVPQNNTNGAVLFIKSGKDVNVSTANNGVWTNHPKTMTSDGNGWITIVWKSQDGVSPSDYTVMLEVGTTPNAYVPYTGNTNFTIQLGQTVYGGSLNLTTGEMTVNDISITFDGSSDEGWSRYNQGSASAYAMQIDNTTGISDTNNVRPMTNGASGLNASDTYGNYDCFISTSHGANWIAGRRGISTVEDWKTWLASNPIQVCYKLATPTTVQLTPTDLQMLKGYNLLSSDSGGDITVTAYTGAAWGGDEA